jgi:hypothetical protein
VPANNYTCALSGFRFAKRAAIFRALLHELNELEIDPVAFTGQRNYG